MGKVKIKIFTEDDKNYIHSQSTLGFHTGPPAIHTFWYNLHGGEGLFRGAGAVFPVSLEKLYLEVGKHIAAGKYTIFSINVTEFSFVILCYSKMTDEEGTAMLREIFM